MKKVIKFMFLIAGVVITLSSCSQSSFSENLDHMQGETVQFLAQDGCQTVSVLSLEKPMTIGHNYHLASLEIVLTPQIRNNKQWANNPLYGWVLPKGNINEIAETL